jgi:hypothetical protein
LFKALTDHHVKDSEKRVLACKALMWRIKSQELDKKLREILIKKNEVRDAPRSPTLLPPANEPFLYACLPLCNTTFRDWL